LRSPLGLLPLLVLALQVTTPEDHFLWRHPLHQLTHCLMQAFGQAEQKAQLAVFLEAAGEGLG
jgi:hypothetical protein